MKSRTDKEHQGAGMEINTPWTPRHRWQRRLRHLPLLQRSQWQRQAVLWCGAVLIAVVAVLFAHGADAAVLAERELAYSLVDMLMATPPYRAPRTA